MILGSMFAGIGGFEKAFADCGVQHAWSAEQDATCNNVRKRHFPHETTVGDVRDIRGSGFAVDVITAGWPCQGNSVAGRRAGMADERSGLWGEVVRVLAEQRPRIFLGENVPGILSVCGCQVCSTLGAFIALHNERAGRNCGCSRCNGAKRVLKSHAGRDFCKVLADLAELGYGFAYRVLNAEYFGVPQRRNRVFLVACIGNWRNPAEILFERESLPWNNPPRREKGPDVAATLTRGADSGGRGGYAGRRREDDLNIVAACLNSGENNGGFRTESGEHLVACALTQRPYADNESRESLLVPFIFETRIGRNGRGQPSEVAHALRGAEAGETSDMRPCVVTENRYERNEQGGNGEGEQMGKGGVPQTDERPGVSAMRNGNPGYSVRRLTPTECERLQGFPDNWTAEGADGKQIADGPRYRMIGNSVAVPVVRWIAERIVNLDRRARLKGQP